MHRRRFSTLLAFVAAALAPHEAPGQTLLYTIRGDEGLSFFGGAISGGGDIDGDGVGDLVMTSGWKLVHVVSGKDGRLLQILPAPGAGQVTAVCATTDINQDGYGDLLLGDDNANNSAGLVQLLSGRDFSVLHAAVGDDVVDQLGTTVAMLGDLDGDGRADYAAGATQHSQIWSDPGYIRTFSGQDGAALWTVHGDYPSGEVGWSGMGTELAGTSDLDGDGLADMVAGMPGHSLSVGLWTGLARAYSGADGATLHSIPGSFGCQLFGSSVAGLRDLDGDGHAEFAAGAPTDYPIFCGGPGLVSVRSGSTGAELFTCVGASGGKLGATVASTKDVDGDSVPDILSAEPFTASVKVYSGSGGAQLMSAPVAGYYPDVVVVGDLDGDGLDEFLASDPYASSAGWGTGAVSLHSLATLDCGATITEGGLGCPGTGGRTPRLALRGCAAQGSLSLNLTSALGGAQAFVLVGTGVDPYLPIDVCQPAVDPVVAVWGVPLPQGGAGEGWFGISARVPAGIPVGTTLAAQVFVADPGAASGFAASNHVVVGFP